MRVARLDSQSTLAERSRALTERADQGGADGDRAGDHHPHLPQRVGAELARRGQRAIAAVGPVAGTPAVGLARAVLSEPDRLSVARYTPSALGRAALRGGRYRLARPRMTCARWRHRGGRQTGRVPLRSGRVARPQLDGRSAWLEAPALLISALGTNTFPVVVDADHTLLCVSPRDLPSDLP